MNTQKQNDILHFTSIKPGETLALNMTLGTLSYLITKDNCPMILAEQRFTINELSILRPLLEAYPNYSPYEVLLASLLSGHVTEDSVTYYRKRLQEAQEEQCSREMLAPLRSTSSRIRCRIRAMHLNLDIASISYVGYILLRKDNARENRIFHLHT